MNNLFSPILFLGFNYFSSLNDYLKRSLNMCFRHFKCAINAQFKNIEYSNFISLRSLPLAFASTKIKNKTFQIMSFCCCFCAHLKWNFMMEKSWKHGINRFHVTKTTIFRCASALIYLDVVLSGNVNKYNLCDCLYRITLDRLFSKLISCELIFFVFSDFVIECKTGMNIELSSFTIKLETYRIHEFGNVCWYLVISFTPIDWWTAWF